MISKCNVCGMFETAVSNGDCSGCSECYSIEQGFKYYEEWEHDCNIMVDEDGNLWDYECEYIIGSEL